MGLSDAVEYVIARSHCETSEAVNIGFEMLL